MALRQRPFGEWVIVYYEAGKTDTEKLLKRLRANKCPRAKHIVGKVETKGAVGLVSVNPIVVRGDLLQFDIKSKGKKAKIAVKAPDGWTVLTPSELDLSKQNSVMIQTPHTNKMGKFKLTVGVQVDGGAQTIFEKSVDLVKLVGKRAKG